MSKPIVAIGMTFFLIVTFVNFTPASIPIFANLQGDLNNTLIHGEKNRFRFFVFGDTKHEAGNLGRLNDIFEQAKAKNPLFMILLGDFVSTGTDRKYRFFIDKVKSSGVLQAGVPLFLVLGNHDMDEKARTKRLFRKYFGPTYYWFSYGNSLFVVADTGDSSLDKAQFQWIESILKEKRKNFLHTFVFMHIPPTDFDFNQTRRVQHVANEFMDLMERYRVDEVFVGHYHSYRRLVENGVTYLLTGGGGSKLEDDESFFHYVEVLVDGPLIMEKVVALNSSHDYSDYAAYNFDIYILPWLLSFYPYLFLSLVLVSIFVLIVIFQRRNRKESR